MPIDYEKKWVNIARRQLVGRTIESVKFMSEKLVEDWMWHKVPLQITLSAKPADKDKRNKIVMTPVADDEHNNGGALSFEGFQQDKFLIETTLPTL